MEIWKKVKSIFLDGGKIDNYARWFVRIMLLIGIAYLVFFNDAKTITVFNETTKRDSVIIVIDHQIIEKQKEYLKIREKRYEVYSRIDSIPNDSLHAYIIRTINKSR